GRRIDRLRALERWHPHNACRPPVACVEDPAGRRMAAKGSPVLTLVYLIAITAEAMSGALAAGRRSMDVFGVAVIAFVTALGGGTIRDVILGHYPIRAGTRRVPA